MQPIYVEVSDEITTVIERMKQANDLVVALVVPKGAILLQSIVNLKLAKKAAADANKEVILITTDKIGRNLATQVGIAVYSRLDAQNVPEDDPSQDGSAGDEPHIVSGVKIHRYYDHKEDEKATEEDLPPETAPIIPKELMREAPSEEETVEEEAPIVIRQMAAPEIPEKTVTKDTPAQSLPPNPEVTPQKEPDEEASGQKNQEDQEYPEEKPVQKRLKFRRPLIFLAYLLVLVVLGSAGLGVFYLPRTTVTIAVKAKPWEQEFSTIAKVEAGTISEDNLIIPASLITSQASGDHTFPTTGSKDIGEKAKGSALIFNGYSSTPQELPAGARLRANGLDFITENAVTVPGARVEGGKPVPGQISVNVIANLSGTESNLKGVTGTIVTPTTNLYCQISEMTGGSTKKVAVLTQTDIANAQVTLNKTLKDELKNKLDEAIKERDVLLDEKTDLYNQESFTLSAPAGTETESAKITLKISGKRLVIDKPTLKSSIENRIKKSSPADVNTIMDRIEPSTTEIKTGEQTATLVSKASGRISAIIPLDSIRGQLVGKKKESGLNLINLVVKDAEIKIEQSPDWWPNRNFPYSPAFLRVKISYE